MFKHILVPTDGSELSQQTAHRAILFAKEINARITFFSAREAYHTDYSGEGALVDFITPEDFDARTAQRAEQILGELSKASQEAGVPCTASSSINDTPYKAIIEAAETGNCDLIFMASHGRRGITGILMGSQTNKVLSNSKIPVLVYR